MQNKIDIQYIKLWIVSQNKNFYYVDGNYQNAFTKLIFHCEICQNDFESYWGTLSQGTGCPFCSNKKVWIGNSLPFLYPEIAKQWDYEKNYPLLPEEVIKGSHRKIWWICSLGHSWIASVNNRTLKNSSCPYCEGRKPHADNNLSILYPDICLDWDYSKNIILPENLTQFSGKQVYWKCHKCNNEWITSVANRTFNLSKCPLCGDKSIGESKISKFLINYNIKYFSPYSFYYCRDKHALPFDFYLPENNICIEYQGIQHYKPIDFFGGEQSFIQQCKRDNIKREYCHKENIFLLEISYLEFYNIKDILCGKLL